MMFRLIIAVMFFTLLASCEKEEIVPRTNPRFSVTLVQAVSEDGAEFRAHMIDYGSDEILEYGFVYSESVNPTISYADYVSESGAPQENFTLSASYGLIKGTRYYVSAFLRTSSGIVYSSPAEFLSLGSDGFIFDRLEIAQPTYFGDTIHVFAEKLSNNLQYYEVRINGFPSQVIDLTKESFGIIIPSYFQINRIDNQFIYFNLDITIAGKKLEINEIISFKEPQFLTSPTQEVFYQEEVVIKGDFLTSDNVQVILKTENDGKFPLPVLKFGEKEITFLAKINNYIAINGSVYLVVRGKEYLLEDVFRMKGSELALNQKFSGRFNSYYSVKGNHFIEEYQSNEFATNIPGVTISSGYSSSDEVGINFDGAILVRDLKIYANNYGQKSENFAEFHFTDPHLKFLKMPTEFVNFRHVEESGVTVDGNGYFFLERNVYKIESDSRKVEKVATAPESVYNIAGGFSHYSLNGKIYLGAISNSVTQKSFWEFDPKTNILKQLANIPSAANKPKLVYSTSTHLYFEGGYTTVSGGYIWDPGVFKYSFATNKWEKLSREFDNDQYLEVFRTFRYEGELYSVVINAGSIFPNIKRFNITTESWENYADLSYEVDLTETNEIFVIGDWVYSFQNNLISGYNMRTKLNKIWTFSYSLSLFKYNYSFQSTNKIYALSGSYLYEFDPEYFDQ